MCRGLAIVRRAMLAGVTAVILISCGCSGDSPAAASHSSDALKKEAESQKQMRYREAHNR